MEHVSFESTSLMMNFKFVSLPLPLVLQFTTTEITDTPLALLALCLALPLSFVGFVGFHVFLWVVAGVGERGIMMQVPTALVHMVFEKDKPDPHWL